MSRNKPKQNVSVSTDFITGDRQVTFFLVFLKLFTINITFRKKKKLKRSR